MFREADIVKHLVNGRQDWISSASRIDKFVHSTEFVSCIQLKKVHDVQNLQALKDELRKKFPTDMHLLELIPVTKRFNAKRMCRGRKYEYYAPLRIFLPI